MEAWIRYTSEVNVRAQETPAEFFLNAMFGLDENVYVNVNENCNTDLL